MVHEFEESYMPHVKYVIFFEYQSQGKLVVICEIGLTFNVFVIQ